MKIAISTGANACPSCGQRAEMSADWRQVYGHRCQHGEPCPAGGFDVTCAGCIAQAEGRPLLALVESKPRLSGGPPRDCAVCKLRFRPKPFDTRTVTCSAQCREARLEQHREKWRAKAREPQPRNPTAEEQLEAQVAANRKRWREEKAAWRRSKGIPQKVYRPPAPPKPPRPPREILTPEQIRERNRHRMAQDRADHPELTKVRNRIYQRRKRGQEPHAADLAFVASYWNVRRRA